MSEEHPSEVLAGLPHTRPHRRSDKRAAPARAERTQMPASGGAGVTTASDASPGGSTRPGRENRPAPARTSAPGATKRASASTARARQPAQPPGTPRAATRRRPLPAQRVELIGSAVHLSAEIAELGISAGARALRGVVARLPKP